jgi:3-deoxy-D-manno-octulosonate 8-phosphate phosphatase (KDO 8-P phosphatase)
VALSTYELDLRARRLKLLILDVDGVLTDASILIGEDGREAKSFSIRDGAAMLWARQNGLEIAWLSGRPSKATTHRAEELGVSLVVQSGAAKKLEYEKILEMKGLTDEQVAFMGDDLQDLAVLLRVGLSGAPGDAVPDVRGVVHWVSHHPGGHGAVREFIELVLRARGRWDPLVAMQMA